MPNDDIIVLSVFMALEGVHAYSAFLPSVFTIRTFVDTPLGASMIREGELFASVFLIALAVVVSFIAKSAIPFWFGIVSGTAMILVYERALKQAQVGGE